MSGGRDLFESEEEAREARARNDFGDPFSDAAELAEKRGRGRPRGALNVKTRDFERYYQAMGYLDPLVGDARFISVDPVALLAWFAEHEPVAKRRPSLWDIVQEQNQVRNNLKPYLHGKKPVQIEIIDERLPTLIVDLGSNQLDEARRLARDGALSIGAPVDAGTDPARAEKDNEINDAEGEE